MLAIALVLFVNTGFFWWIPIVFVAVFYLVKSLEIELNESLPWLYTVILFGLGATFTMFSIQYMLLEWEDFMKTPDIRLFTNVCIVLLFYLLGLIITKNAAVSAVIGHVILLIFAFVNYFVYQFRGNEFGYADLKSIGTGLSVAGKYNYSINQQCAYVILVSIIFITLVLKFKVKFKNIIPMRIIAFLLMVISGLIIIYNSIGVITETWEQKGTYRNGYLMNFVLQIRDSHIAKPEGYSADAIKELEIQYLSPNVEGNEFVPSAGSNASLSETSNNVNSDNNMNSDNNVNSDNNAMSDNNAISDNNVMPDNNAMADNNVMSDNSSSASIEEGSVNSSEILNAGKNDSYVEAEKPTIIAIMNESFADLSVLGEFTTNFELTPFMNSLKENTIKGYALASVYGAKTPNSEWEFMTGNSMAFLPEGSVVYQQYINDTPDSIVSTLKNEGYTAVAMHPYYETGWSRNTIYPTLGFDEMYFIDDFNQKNIVREYITDKEMYDKIIERFNKKKSDENLFIMGITMQNHGGYGEPYDNFIERIYKVGTSYTDANQYLSLVNESDKALRELVTFFENVDEPVEIVFFGDHQPGLNSNFIRLLNGKGTSGLTMDELEALYTVPFFIWTNYDTKEETLERCSLNYLSTIALERANIKLPPYNRFLAEIMEEIPAMNSQGYYSKQNGEYIHYEQAEGTEAEWLDKYNILQYNAMFDARERSEVFFPYIK